MSVEQFNLNLIEYDQSKLSPRKEKEIFLNLSAPVTVQWEVTPWCNERCVHCYNFWRQEPLPALHPSLIAQETFHKAAAEIAENDVFHVTVTGGEPLAVLKWILPDLEYLSERGVHLSLNSNLTLLTPDKAKILNKLGVRTVLTSLMSADAALNDSLANSKGALEKVVRGIRIAREEGLWVAVNMVVTKKNLHDIFSTAKLVKELGVDAFSATKASRPIGSSDFSEVEN